MNRPALLGVLTLLALSAPAASQAPATDSTRVTLLVPARVFDGFTAAAHEGWVVRVRGNHIDAVGPAADVTAPAGATTIRLSGLTLLPGLIDAHTHLLLHPYNETPWDQQVLRENEALRVAR